MRTDKLIDKIMSRVASSVTRIEVREYLNEVQNYIMARAIALSRVQPDPILLTQEATFRYTANTAIVDDDGAPVGDIYTIRRIYRDDGLGPTSQYEKLVETTTGDQVEIRASYKPSGDANSDDCEVIWPRKHNPHATTSLWRCEVFLWPAQLDSEQIQLTVPADAHLSLLMMGVLEQVEGQEFGNGGWPSQKFQQALVDFDNKHSLEVVQPGDNTIPYSAC